jgi:hypothetical protein
MSKYKIIQKFALVINVLSPMFHPQFECSWELTKTGYQFTIFSGVFIQTKLRFNEEYEQSGEGSGKANPKLGVKLL